MNTRRGFLRSLLGLPALVLGGAAIGCTEKKAKEPEKVSGGQVKGTQHWVRSGFKPNETGCCAPDQALSDKHQHPADSYSVSCVVWGDVTLMYPPENDKS